MFNLEEYTTVAERIKLFREMYPMGRILTYLVFEDATRVVFRAELYRDDEDQRPFSTGYAREITSDRGVNRDFALENCETSAIGISAKNAGIGTEKNSISREEAAKVNRVNQTKSAIEEAKAKMAQTTKEYVPVPKEDDPWTIRDAAPVSTIDDAVNTVKDIIGEQSEIPKCPTCDHDMTWRTGTSKAGKPWANFTCKRAVGSGICNQVIWYEVSAAGKWQPQKARA